MDFRDMLDDAWEAAKEKGIAIPDDTHIEWEVFLLKYSYDHWKEGKE